MYDVYARMFQCQLSPIIYTAGQFMEPPELCSTIPDKAKVLFLPNPSQPVENCFDLDGLSYIANHCQEHGMVFAVEPMINAGTPDVEILDDEWTAVTADGAVSAHFEHTILVTDDGPEVLTRVNGSH
mgnify:CR=1 FL=1